MRATKPSRGALASNGAVFEVSTPLLNLSDDPLVNLRAFRWSASNVGKESVFKLSRAPPGGAAGSKGTDLGSSLFHGYVSYVPVIAPLMSAMRSSVVTDKDAASGRDVFGIHRSAAEKAVGAGKEEVPDERHGDGDFRPVVVCEVADGPGPARTPSIDDIVCQFDLCAGLDVGITLFIEGDHVLSQYNVSSEWSDQNSLAMGALGVNRIVETLRDERVRHRDVMRGRIPQGEVLIDSPCEREVLERDVVCA